MMNMKRKQGYKRGHPVALLVGFDGGHAVLWQVFSHVAKPYLTIDLAETRTNERVLYAFYESVVNALRPVIKEGIRSIVATAPMRTTYARDFLNHVQKHHAYLIQSKGPSTVTFAEIVGRASQPHDVAELVKTKEFRKAIAETTSEEADNIINVMEKNLYATDNKSVVLFSLKEIEDIVYDRNRRNAFETRYLILTDKYIACSDDTNRIHRLLQISANKKVKTRIIKAETPAGKRMSQFGGIVFFTIPKK
jgi:stalled ribosome rescue protein Dom34